MPIAVEIRDKEFETAARIDDFFNIIDRVVREARADTDGGDHLRLDFIQRMTIGKPRRKQQRAKQDNGNRAEQLESKRHREFELLHNPRRFNIPV